ncbi:hypothetical protein COW36_15250 [bacterium (Candidatus Blackallbacteria) CG17_big_fil_post_rev_8_21_14_2_50_48_46]|uniref:Insulinase family protein n=1 Tax=bacterium (Candidatus Blackallbacteria) CG17_big_fil_post_rev_8_21_14_2_50_48_46 TaxID=2014261 RepID=A0A2M7G2P3_9BACT|nr:MAG: hypothetical protein COW64_11300 [bacterium (Candidatus Blackallbacteria) CG18_big_fil_WC_8_21_14_2_50_49_26]PIW16066.1 MAG: hypothetical protein COW36_15250 [bacterium (Candidatus Blackallbacteria) CG17_big_fil_post_rev_8_21_14_2_50_48_46]PIW50478.1 MAG: hypothetical protein COW20_02965 [bacterium (Candidatus Blackallbacteria) CG13_big_fil_rev_8_21_14_2_50_49_14]
MSEQSNLASSTAVQETILPNGLRVLIKQDSALPVVTVMLWYHTGSGNETSYSGGISHFLEHMLFKGTLAFPRGEIDRRTLSGGGENNAYTWLDNTAYYFNFASDRWEIALEIEADRMRNCLLESEEIEAERQVILEEWRTSQDDAEENLWEAVTAAALSQHPYRYPVLGSEQDIREMRSEDLRRYYQDWYTPNNATLVIVGDIQPEVALERVRHYFEPLKAGTLPLRMRIQEPQPQAEKRILLRKAEVTLPRLAVAWPAPGLTHPDYYPLTLLQYILAEGMSSLLYQELVEDRQVASDVDASGFETAQPYLFWILVDGLSAVPLEATEAALWEVLAKIQAGDWDPAHLLKARNQILTDFHLSQETTEDQAELLGELDSLADWRFMLDYVERIQAVQFQDITRVAKELLAPEKRTVGWLLPEDPEAALEESPEGAYSGSGGISERLHTRPQASRIQSFTQHELPKPHLWFPVLEAEKRVLPNGMTLLVHENRRIPTLSLEIFIPSGSLHDPLGQQGLANLTAAVLIKGTLQRPGLALHRYLESMGGSLSIVTGLSGTFLGLEILAEYLEPALLLLHEIMTSPAFAQIELEREKRLILTDLEAYEEQASYRASREFYRQVYGAFPAAWPETGLSETVSPLGLNDLQAFYRNWYGSQGATLALSGAVSATQALASLESIWSDWQMASGNFVVPTLPRLQTERKVRQIKLKGKEQCQVYLGHLGIARTHPDYAALQVLDLVLGAGPGFTSRLPARLREQEGLAYSTGSSITGSAGLYPGVFMAWMETRSEGVKPGIRAMFEEIDKLQQAGITQHELDQARTYLSGRLPFRFETNDQRVGFLLQREIYQWPENHLQQHWQHLEALTPEAVQSAACRHLHPEAMTLVVAGADARLKSWIKEFENHEG